MNKLIFQRVVSFLCDQLGKGKLYWTAIVRWFIHALNNWIMVKRGVIVWLHFWFLCSLFFLHVPFFCSFISLVSYVTKCCNRMCNSPVQFTPSPEYPGSQLHRNEPGSFTQSALDEQLLTPGALHSSTSVISLVGWSELILHFTFSNAVISNGRKIKQMNMVLPYLNHLQCIRLNQANYQAHSTIECHGRFSRLFFYRNPVNLCNFSERAYN